MRVHWRGCAAGALGTPRNSNKDKLRRELNYKLNYKFELRIKAVPRARLTADHYALKVTQIIRPS